jgi:hypothetical protein
MESMKQLMIGLPESGKTTFLAALWHVVETGEVAGSLVVSQVHGIRDYLNQIRQEWLNCYQLGRTLISAEKLVSFRLKDPSSGKIVELSLPDLSGESYRLQWETRQWTAGFDEFAAGCGGGVLFVHPRTIVEPVRIDSQALDGMVDIVEDPQERAVPSSRSQLAQQSITPWTPNHAPTQVKLVEILQFLLMRTFRKRRMPIAIIVSAWDLIENGETPSEWICKRLPLLDQFLHSNFEQVPSRAFGVSAQGGELSQAIELQSHTKASDRIIVAGCDKGKTHDITEPLKWLLNQVMNVH